VSNPAKMGTLLILISFIIINSTTLLISDKVEASEQTRILYVNNTPQQYTSLSEAVGNAPEGAVIRIPSGVYNESNIIINKSLTLTGLERTGAIINGGKKGSVIIILADNVTITNLTIQNSGRLFPDAGIKIYSSNNKITNNTLTENYYGVVLMEPSKYNLISSNNITNNHQCGVYFSGSKHNTLIHNNVTGNPFNGFGLYDFSDYNTIQGNTFSYNDYSGVNIRDSYHNIIVDNVFIGNTRGLHLPQPEYQTKHSDNQMHMNKVPYEEEKNHLIISMIAYSILVIIGFMILKKKN
jgi:parallel beta-helix repeat protein